MSLQSRQGQVSMPSCTLVEDVLLSSAKACRLATVSKALQFIVGMVGEIDASKSARVVSFKIGGHYGQNHLVFWPSLP